MAKIKSLLKRRFLSGAGLTVFAGMALVIIFFTIQSISTLWTQQLSTSGRISLASWLQTTPTPSATPFLPVPPSTTLKGSITAAGFLREVDGGVEFSAQSDSAAGIRGEICVSNEGEYSTENLSIENIIQTREEKGAYEDLLTNSMDLGAHPVLESGESFCYPYAADFTPPEKGTSQFRNVALITITNHADWTPGSANCPGPDVCAFGPTLAQDFELPGIGRVTPTGPPPATIPPSPTNDPSPTPTPTPNTVSETPDLTATPSSTPRPTPTLAPSQETLEPSQTPVENAVPTASASPLPTTIIPTPAETQATVDTPTATATPPANTPTPTAQPVPTETPAATSTPLPADTPTPAPSLDLAVRVTDDEASTAPGGVVVYSIYFSNNGDTPATGVTLSDTLPEHTTLNADSSFPGWKQIGSTNEYTYSVGDLPARDTGVVNLAVKVDNPFPSGEDAITNTASIWDDEGNGR
ncbi:MAG TPA: hypothetical protein VE136_11750, partial [Anaerolineales bacterium]|nr:hypothetical protein [Anaerolineales bacterium]